MKKNRGAGLILFKKESDTILFCCLEKFNGKYDLPKGGVDFGEHELDCAKREAYEEANIKERYYKFIKDDGNIVHISQNENLVLYLCKIKKDYINNLRIKRNPNTYKFEHKKIMWLTAEKIEANFPKYLRGCLFKALEKINNLS